MIKIKLGLTILFFWFAPSFMAHAGDEAGSFFFPMPDLNKNDEFNIKKLNFLSDRGLTPLIYNWVKCDAQTNKCQKIIQKWRQASESFYSLDKNGFMGNKFSYGDHQALPFKQEVYLKTIDASFTENKVISLKIADEVNTFFDRHEYNQFALIFKVRPKRKITYNFVDIVHQNYTTTNSPIILEKNLIADEAYELVVPLTAKINKFEPVKIQLREAAKDIEILEIKLLVTSTNLTSTDPCIYKPSLHERFNVDSNVSYFSHYRTNYHEILLNDSKTKFIGIIGGSTVEGCGSNHRGTISNTLTQVLQSQNPDMHLRVLNLGIASSGFSSHIISVNNNHSLTQNHFPKLMNIKKYSDRFPSLSEMKLNILIISQHWNDLIELDEYLSKNCLVLNKRFWDKKGHKKSYVNDLDYFLDKVYEMAELMKTKTLFSEQDRFKKQVNELSKDFEAFLECPVNADIKLSNRAAHLEFLLTKFVEQMHKHSPKTKLVLMTQPSAVPPPSKDASPELQRIQISVYRKVAKKFNLPFINLAEIIETPFKNKKRFQKYARAQLFTDVVHFTEIGNTLQAHLIAPTISTELVKNRF